MKSGISAKDGRWYPRLKTNKEMGRKEHHRELLTSEELKVLKAFRALKLKRMNWFRFLNIAKELS